MDIKRGDLIYVDLGQHPNSSIQSGKRPCVVISCNKCNVHAPTITICPLSTKCEKRFIKTHVEISVKDVDGYLSRKSIVFVEQVCTIDKRKIDSKIGHLKETSKVLRQIEQAICVHLDINYEEIVADLYSKGAMDC